MEDRLSAIEASIRDLDRRLRALERTSAAAPEPEEPNFVVPPLVRQEAAGEALTLIGRTLVALGGAYLLRALTDSKALPPPVGVSLGFIYAAAWLAAADRDGGRNRRTSAAFHAVVASLVAFPLIWEATNRFAILGVVASAGALTIAALAGVAVALHRGVPAVAWLTTSMALPTAIALIAATGRAVPYTVFLVAFGVATLWVGYAWNWTLLRWPAAVVADVAVFALAVRASGAGRGAPLEPALQVLAIQLLLLNGYLGSIVVRTIIRARDVIAFEVVQTAAALAVGFGGAVYVAQLTGYGATALAVINLIFGFGCYAVAFLFVRERPRNFYFYSTLAIVLVITSGRLLLDNASLALAFDALAVACTLLAVRTGRVTLTAHAAMYVVSAAVASRLLSTTIHALAGPVDPIWPPVTGAALTTLGVMAFCWAWPTPGRATLLPHEWAPRVLMAILLAASAAGWVVSIVAPLVAAPAGAGIDAGIVATIRTAAIAAAALLCGRVGRDARFRESLWLLYPVLAAGGVKLLVEDFPRSQPSTLFLALAVYGGALIAAPRLSRRRA